MESPNYQIVDLSLKLLSFRRDGNVLAAMNCPECGSKLDVHQPEPGHPERMLGTCTHCHHWFLADFAPGHDQGVVVFLPDNSFFLNRKPAG